MKNRANQILLGVLIGSTALYILLLCVDVPLSFDSVRNLLLVSFHAIPFFCLQLLLCRNVKRKLICFLPLLLLGLIVAYLFVSLFSAEGWDGLALAVMLVMCLAPVVGCILGWVVHGLCRRAGK